MAESNPVNPSESGVESRTWFVRGRNAVVARVDMSDLYVDYYLHLAKNRLQPEAGHDRIFKEALAAFVLHASTRPWNEHIAWTINFQEPRVNVFLVADNADGAVVGRVFEENVKEREENIFYADVVRGAEARRRSAVPFRGPDALEAAEVFYRQSEQRIGRAFHLQEDEFALVIEHPDCDLAWLRDLTTAGAAGLEQNETLALLERRIHRWHCGCNQQRMMEVLAPAMRADPEDLFGSEPKLEIRCPRCAARHVLTREAMESYVADEPRHG